MRKARFTEHQIIAVLKSVEAGRNREALAIEIDLNIPAQRVVRVLDRIVANRGYPLKLRMNNGPELISLTLTPVPAQPYPIL